MSWLFPTPRKLKKVEEVEKVTKVESIDTMPDPTPRGSEGVAFRQTSPGAGAWVSPTGHDDPDDKWSNETKAYDDDVNTLSGHVTTSGWGSFLILTFATTVASKMRFYAKAYASGALIDVDVYKDGGWVDVYQGSDWDAKTWIEKTFGEGNVTKVRIRFYTVGLASNAIYEVDIWQVPTTGGEMYIQPLHVGTYEYFSKTSTGDVKAPSTGKKLKIHSAFFASSADITARLRWKTSGKIILSLFQKGAVGMIFTAGFNNPHLGDTDEAVEIYLSGTGTVEGWIVWTEV